MVPETMTSADVCVAFNITRKTLERWEKDGKIPFTRVGRKKIYLAEDIERIIFEKYRR